MSSNNFYLYRRPRINRKKKRLRESIAETSLRPEDLVQPLFVSSTESSDIKSLPGQKRLNLKDLKLKLLELKDLGVGGVALFPVVPDSDKNETASKALSPHFYTEALQLAHEITPELVSYSDVALDPYTSHGQDGLVDKSGHVLNDETVDILSQMAVLHAQSGVDFVAPSDMMDGRVIHIKMALDEAGFNQTGLMSYAAKYASSLYGPFREALGSTLAKGSDKKTYQMDPRNRKEALLEAQLDFEEGADALMVKPAGFYQDVIRDLENNFHLPIHAYQVSGEYSMIKKAVLSQDLDSQVILESLYSLKRAGARIIWTYFAAEIASQL